MTSPAGFCTLGVSDSLAVRWGRYAATSPWWPEVAIKTVEWYPARRTALDAETAAIAAESPIHNKRRPPAEEMTMRSWYLPRTSAAQLSARHPGTSPAARFPLSRA